MGRDIVLTNNGEARFAEARANGNNEVTLKAPATLAGDIDFILPAALPAATELLRITSGGQIETTTGSQAYASIYDYTDTGAGNITLTTEDSWYQITSFTTDGAALDATPDYTSNEITIGTSGVYEVAISISFSGTGAHTYEICAASDADGAGGGPNYEQGVYIVRKLGASGDVGSGAASGILSLTAGHTVEMHARSTSGSGNNINPHACALSIRRVA